MALAPKIISLDDLLKDSKCNIFFQRDREMFVYLTNYMFSHINTFARYMPINDPKLVEWINQNTSLLNNSNFKYSLGTKVHWILMGLTDFPTCANPRCKCVIGIDTNVNWRKGYSQYCSLRCGTQCSREKANETLHQHLESNPEFFNEVEIKKRETRLKNFGNETFNNREKAANTCLERYGTKHPIANEYVFAKSMKTREIKYGIGNLTNHSKTESTCLERYGCRNVFSVPQIHQRCIDTTIERHGSPNAGNKYEFDGLKFDSKPELAYYVWLKDHEKSFIYKPVWCVFHYVFNGKAYRYFPDFLVDNQYVEIKGDHFFKEDGTMQNPFDHSQDGLYEAKHQCMIDNDVKILRQNEYVKFIDYAIETCGNDFFSKCKVK